MTALIDSGLFALALYTFTAVGLGLMVRLLRRDAFLAERRAAERWAR